ncbi:MAG: DeoR/GlpR transcriptional regulator [Fusobacteriaceae bacterium]|nr:DeoR/GlpR transcriptional regulator [Fusobacteriaceae bacterium]MBN2838207.1 DeoR/GlpR transcriptional regulator [Fusobacteriaceae bacterium]
MKIKRIEEIKSYVHENKSVSTEELCAKFNVSRNTIRRDIDILVDKGDIKKVYGGVVSTDEKLSNGLKSYSIRESSNLDKKKLIGKKASEFISDNDVIYLDSGTTIVHIIENLKNIKNLTIITASIPVINQVIPFENIKLVSLHGILSRPTLSFVGNSIIKTLEPFNIDKAFISCNGISIEKQITNSVFEEYEIKKTVISKSKKIYLLADEEKFDNFGAITFARFEEITGLITNASPKNDLLSLLKEKKVELYLCD